MRARERIALVTGANGVIGRAIAEGLARHDFQVVLAVRDGQRGAAAADAVRAASGNPDVRCEVVDVSRRAQVFDLAQRWRGPLHVLVNNAAIAPRQRRETPEGLELQFATNVLGYVWMMQAFEPLLRNSAPARVVNVASYWAGDLRLDDLQFQRRPYDNDTAYRQSKQADRMLSVAFAERWRSSGVTVNSCHPGDANSRLSNDLGFGGSATPAQAADTPVWLATEPSLRETTGGYFAARKAVHCSFAENRASVEALYGICAAL